MDNIVSVERIKIKDIREVFRDLFSTSREENNEKELAKALEAVYKVQDSIGATKGILAAEKFLEKFSLKGMTKKAVNKLETIEVPVQISDNEIENNITEIEEDLEK